MEKRVLGGRYEIIEKIGEGGMAVVFKAKCHLLNRYVAVKVLKAEFAKDKKFIESFNRESQAAASLSHPNIVGVYDVGVEGEDIHYIVMELVDGQSLNEILETVGKVSYKNAVKIAKQVAAALATAHKNNVVHRDIKPHNIMITTDGRAKVTDFGIAKAVSSATVVTNDAIIGSVHYSSPEQARGGYVDNKSDIYSLGILLYEMVTGKVPFDSDTAVSIAMMHINEEIEAPSELQPDIPEDLEEIILKATSKRQGDRYQTAKEMFDALDKVSFAKNTATIKGDKARINRNTKMMAPIKASDIKRDKRRKEKEKDQASLNPSIFKGIFSRVGAVVLAIIVAFFLSRGIIAVKGILFVKEVEVPNLIGVNYAVAQEMLSEKGLIYEKEDELYNSNYEKDSIISQNPVEGAIVKEGHTVKYVISKGTRMVKVPVLVNKTIDDAIDLIEVNKLIEGIIVYEASALPVGRVIRQEPNAKIDVEEGTEINLVVSEGEKIETILMIDLIGKKLDAAIKNIEAAGLKVGKIETENNPEIEPNTVLDQSIVAGEEVDEQTAIDLLVSHDGGVINEVTSGAIEESESTELQSVTLSLVFDSAKEDTFEVNVYEIIDDKMTLLYYGIHHKGEDADVIIRGNGESKIAIYYDTDLYGEKNVNYDTGEVYD